MADEIGTLKVGERLLIFRRRTGSSQVETAAEFDVSLDTYVEVERGKPGCIGFGWLNPAALLLPTARQLLPHERCLIYRRRAGFSQARVAKEIGCCRYWVNQMELGKRPCDDLLWYWEQ